MRTYIAILLIIFSSCQEQRVKELQSKEAETQRMTGPISCSDQDLDIDNQLRSPSSITEVVELVNALPRPLNLPCFLSSLARPLNIYPTDSARSAQPARGDRSPRVFLMFSPLVLSVVVEGGASVFLEMSEFSSDQKSIKAEIKFPIMSEQITLESVFTKVDIDGIKSTCAGCHEGENKISHSLYPGPVYESFAIKPSENQKLNVNDFRSEFFLCDLQAQSDYRCDMIYSIFNYGEVQFQDFPAGTPTFFESLAL